MTKHTGSTRDLLISSWRAAQRNDQKRCNAASMAGQLLDEANGDASAALSVMPPDDDPYWKRVKEYLERVVEDDRAACA